MTAKRLAIYMAIILLSSALGSSLWMQEQIASGAESPGPVSLAMLEQAELVTVSLNPQAVTLGVGQTEIMSVEIGEGSVGLYGAQLEVAYDPAILQVDAISPGPMAMGNGQEEQAGGFIQDALVDNSGGTASYVISLLDPAEAVNGAGQIAQLSVRCLSEGLSDLDIIDPLLSSRDSFEIPSEGQGGNVACTAGATGPSFDLHQDVSDGATGLKVDITGVTSPDTANGAAVPLVEFQVQLTYDGSCVNILALRELDFPITSSNIDDPGGSATFSGADPEGKIAPVDLGLGLIRLLGSGQEACDVSMEVLSLTDDGGNTIPVVPSGLGRTLLRGDALADGTVDIADALIIVQYLVGLKDACTTVVDSSCLHPVNAASVRHDGDFDQITVADALFIAQYLAGLRDQFYNLVQ